MSTAVTVGLVAVGVVVAGLLTYVVVKSFLFVVDQGTVLVVKRFGRHHKVCNAGPNFKWPIIDTKHRVFDSKRRSLPLELQGDSGGRLPVEMTVDLVVEGVIEHGKVFELAYKVTDPMQHLRSVAIAEVRQLLLPMSFDEIMADTDLAYRVADALRPVAAECGFTIITARITSIRPERTVQAAIVDAERNKQIRGDQAAQTEHDATMRLRNAESTAAASAIEAKADRERLDGQTAQVAELLARLISGGASKDNAAAIITALLNQQTAMAVGSNSKAQVILTPTGLTIPDNISTLTARPAPANTPAASVE